jgi:hypothetical protein
MRRWLVSATLGVALVTSVLAAQAPTPAASVSTDTPRVSANTVVSGELVIEPPTLINLGFEWFIQGRR